MPSPYRSPKTFKLKPYQSKARGRERISTGMLLLIFALVNLYMVSMDGIISLLFALFFGWSGLRNISLGLRLQRLPEKDRAYRVSTHGLFKILDGKELARLELREIKAVWFNADQTKLSLMTHRGVETLSKDELIEEEEWSEFTTWVERSITETIYRDDPSLWADVQQQSELMSQMGERKLIGSKMLIMASIIGASVFFYFLQFHLPFFIQTGHSDLLTINIGGPSGYLITQGEFYRLFAGLMIPSSGLSLLFDLVVLYWVGRSLEQIWGTWRILAIYFSGYLSGVISLALIEPHAIYVGAHGSAVALCMAAYLFPSRLRGYLHISSMPVMLKKANSASFILGLIFILFLGFENEPSTYMQLTWLISALIGGAFGLYFGEQSKQQKTWILKDANRHSALLSIFGTAIPISCIIFGLGGMNQDGVSHIKTLPESYTPLAIVELAQRCSGVPLHELSPLPVEVLESLPDNKRCSNQEISKLQTALSNIIGFYPLLSSDQSHALSVKAHPPYPWVKSLHRANALLNLKEENKARTIASLRSEAILFPQDIYGDLLAAFSTLQSSDEITSFKDEELGQSVILNVNHTPFKIEVNKGLLSWEWDYQTKKTKSSAKLNKESNSHENSKTSDLVWVQVYNIKKEVVKLLMLSLPKEFDAKIHSPGTRKLKLGSDETAQYIRLVEYEQSVSNLPKRLTGKRVRTYVWNTPVKISSFLKKDDS